MFLQIESVKKAVDKWLADLGGIYTFIKSGDTVLIKLNILLAKKPEEAIITHPAEIEAIISVLKK